MIRGILCHVCQVLLSSHLHDARAEADGILERATRGSGGAKHLRKLIQADGRPGQTRRSRSRKAKDGFVAPLPRGCGGSAVDSRLSHVAWPSAAIVGPPPRVAGPPFYEMEAREDARLARQAGSGVRWLIVRRRYAGDMCGRVKPWAGARETSIARRAGGLTVTAWLWACCEEGCGHAREAAGGAAAGRDG